MEVACKGEALDRAKRFFQQDPTRGKPAQGVWRKGKRGRTRLKR